MMLNMLDEVINTVQLSSLIMRKIGKNETKQKKKKQISTCIGAGTFTHPTFQDPSSSPYTHIDTHKLYVLGIITPILTCN